MPHSRILHVPGTGQAFAADPSEYALSSAGHSRQQENKKSG